MRTLPFRFSAPAAVSAASELAPCVQLKTTSPNAAASANVPIRPRAPARVAHSAALLLPGVREPIITAWSSATSFDAIALPTMPVPSTPMFISHRLRRPGMTAAVHSKNCAIDVRRVRAREERRQSRDVVGGPDVAYRYWQVFLQDARFDVIPVVVPTSRLGFGDKPPLDFCRSNESGRNGVDGDARAGDRLAEAHRHIVDGGFRGRVGGHVRKRFGSLTARNLDDPSPALRHHVGHEKLNKAHRGHHVDLE